MPEVGAQFFAGDLAVRHGFDLDGPLGRHVLGLVKPVADYVLPDSDPASERRLGAEHLNGTLNAGVLFARFHARNYHRKWRACQHLLW